MSGPLRSDVIVIGGGLMGAASAFFLRRRGKSVVLIERGLVGQQASGTNFGNVRRQARYLPQLPLANRSREIWGRIGELLGSDVEFVASGHLRLCFQQEQVEVLETHRREALDYGLELELIAGNALRARYPFLGPEIVAATLSPHDGHANPRLTAPAFARAARRDGAQIFENLAAIVAEREGAGFRVDCEGGRVFTADALLVTAGAWAGRLSAAFGEPVPLVAHGPQMAVTEPAPYAIGPSLGISTKFAPEGVYLRQVRRGNVVFGGGFRGPAFPDLMRAYVNPAHTLNQLRHLPRVVPALARLNVLRVWSGIEGYLPDEIPIMGPSGRVPGLFYAFGFCGHGFQLGPGVGDVMAELIATGGTSTPIAPFAITRFART